MLATILLDIVPTKTQWDAFSNPSISRGYFHWPLLANVELALKMLTAYGGGNWVRDQHFRITSSSVGKERIQADGAVEVYAALFEKEETLRYSCEDYAAGAEEEYELQAEDQRLGRKIDVPVLIMFSKNMLGKRIDVAGEWREWVAEGTRYEAVGVEEYGHYLPEEAYDVVGREMGKFIGSLGLK